MRSLSALFSAFGGYWNNQPRLQEVSRHRGASSSTLQRFQQKKHFLSDQLNGVQRLIVREGSNAHLEGHAGDAAELGIKAPPGDAPASKWARVVGPQLRR